MDATKLAKHFNWAVTQERHKVILKLMNYFYTVARQTQIVWPTEPVKLKIRINGFLCRKQTRREATFIYYKTRNNDAEHRNYSTQMGCV